jgi:erythromycin esterase-like protein
MTAIGTHPALSAAVPVTGSPNDYDGLVEHIGDARCVLIGEASHGTHEFYVERARMTRRLIEEAGFNAIAVEADWPAAYRLNCFVRGAGKDATAADALGDFVRFPRWMWRNQVVEAFAVWLRAHNQRAPNPVGFYGLDLYSLHESVDRVLRYLEKVDPEAAARARERYSCFDHRRHGADDAQAYGAAVVSGRGESCESGVVEQLLELQHKQAEYASSDTRLPEDAHFFALQNARLVANAERYYRTMFRGGPDSWNLRDSHMAETLGALFDYLNQPRLPSKVVVWAHNSHVGDARHTEMGRLGQLTLGQLARQRYKRDAFLVGLTTYEGTVTAASDWGAPALVKQVVPGRADAYEGELHDAGLKRDVLLFETGLEVDPRRLERAIGVIYRPETERQSHYFQAEMARQFDAVAHFDRTQALWPLDRDPGWIPEGEAPDTYPFGM